jgi:iron(III) transport system ATP-binding protein
MSGVAAVVVERAQIAYGAQVAVEGASLEISPGELHVLLGRSGSGKTTLLRAIAGFERLRQGSLWLRGALVDDGGRAWTPPERRGVGLVFQDYALFPHLDVGGNLRFGAPSLGAAEVERQLARVGLRGYAGRATAALSGGEQQRVALARALAARPAILLLDEPFSNLDRQLRQELREATVDLLREEGVAAVFVTHDAAEALALGDRLSVMHQGRLLQSGSGPALYLAPRSRAVAQALGAVNFLAAEADGDGARCALGLLPVRADAREGDTLLLRPEQLGLGEAPEGALVSLGEVTVRRRVYQGDHVLFEVAQGELRLRASCPAASAPEGERAALWLKAPGALLWGEGPPPADPLRPGFPHGPPPAGVPTPATSPTA